MAFLQQQQRPPQPRRPSYHQDTAPPAPLQRKRSLEQVQEWVLFAAPSQATTSHTPRTADLSRASQVESLETGARSELLEDDATEFDSLDDGLRDFQPPLPYYDQSGTVLPAHDGLGTFHGSAEALQEHMWQHERYNPQRRHIHRRLSSVHRRLEALEQYPEPSDFDMQEERRLRVEQWRTEQSKLVLEEIERESRRRYRRITRRTHGSPPVALADTATSVVTGHETISTDRTIEGQDGQDSIWERITRKVIGGIMGIDDSTLSVIFGETLVENLESRPSVKPDSVMSDLDDDNLPNQAWEERLLDRINKELSTLADQLTDLESTLHNRPAPRSPAPTSPHDAPLRDIEEEPYTAEDTAYWESHPSMLTVLSYLRNRFRSAPRPAPLLPHTWATPLGTSPESRRRADLLRRHHPLVHPRVDRLGAALAQHRWQGGSCASQSNRRSRGRSSGTGQSRRYWDFGGSREGSSVVSSVGRGGGWAEV